jgi:hypothetical protein
VLVGNLLLKAYDLTAPILQYPQACNPAVDPLDSTSRQLDPLIVGEEHYNVARGVQGVLQRYKELKDIITMCRGIFPQYSYYKTNIHGKLGYRILLEMIKTNRCFYRLIFGVAMALISFCSKSSGITISTSVKSCLSN